MEGLFIPPERKLILPPGLRRPVISKGLRRPPRAGDYFRWGMPLTPAGPGTHSGLPAFVTESAVLSGGAPGVLPAIVATSSQSATANRIAYSLDGGVTWAQSTVPAPSLGWQGLAHSPSLGYAIATSAGGSVVSSTDGITWTSVPGSNLTNGNWRRLIRSLDDTVFVVVGIGGTLGLRVATSPDGVTWTLRTTPTTNSTNWITICQSPVTGRMFCGASASFTQPVIFSDDNGVTWAYAGAAPAGADSIGGNGMFVSASGVVRATGGQGGTTIADFFSQDDGASWTLVDGSPPSGSQGVNTAINDDNGIVIRSNVINPGIVTIGLTQVPPPSTLWTSVSTLTSSSPSDALYSPEWEAWIIATGALIVHRSTSPTAASGSWASTAHGTIASPITNVKAIPFA